MFFNSINLVIYFNFLNGIKAAVRHEYPADSVPHDIMNWK